MNYFWIADGRRRFPIGGVIFFLIGTSYKIAVGGFTSGLVFRNSLINNKGIANMGVENVDGFVADGIKESGDNLFESNRVGFIERI